MGAAVPKVLLDIASEEGEPRSVLRRCIDTFARELSCAQIVVCVPTEWQERCADVLSGVGNVSIIPGGATRQDSVRRGVEFLGAQDGIEPNTPILVHDAARCLVTSEVIARVVQGVREHGAVTAAVKVFDATCSVDINNTVARYVDREMLWSVQTPQGFILEDLVRAHREALREGISALDDASLVARFRAVRVVPGDRLNIKVTEPADLRVVRLVERL
jgi:2-C-methyl-D-erythritol 4-phosphate cytidylyltransferase